MLHHKLTQSSACRRTELIVLAEMFQQFSERLALMLGGERAVDELLRFRARLGVIDAAFGEEEVQRGRRVGRGGLLDAGDL